MTPSQCTWDNNLGAPKYSVDTLINYDLNAGATLSVDLDFDATTTTILIPLNSFPTDPDLDTNTETLVSVVLRVKGLAPVKWKSQNNAFGGTPIIGAACVQN